VAGGHSPGSISDHANHLAPQWGIDFAFRKRPGGSEACPGQGNLKGSRVPTSNTAKSRTFRVTTTRWTIAVAAISASASRWSGRCQASGEIFGNSDRIGCQANGGHPRLISGAEPGRPEPTGSGLRSYFPLLGSRPDPVSPAGEAPRPSQVPGPPFKDTWKRRRYPESAWLHVLVHSYRF
jgi:hypothetical protein